LQEQEYRFSKPARPIQPIHPAKLPFLEGVRIAFLKKEVAAQYST
jgi:hypothetical protein